MTSTWHFSAAKSIWLAKFGKSGDWLTDDDTSLTKFISLKTDQSVSSSSEADGGGQHFILNRVKRSNGPRHITELKRVSSPDSRQVFFIYKITVFSTTQKQSDQFDKIFIFGLQKLGGTGGEDGETEFTKCYIFDVALDECWSDAKRSARLFHVTDPRIGLTTLGAAL